MTIEQDIAEWDGKSSSDITTVYNRHYEEAHFIPKLIELASHKAYQKGATWLLKHHLENKHSLSADDIGVLYQLALSFEGWEAKLHVLQSIPYMPISETDKQSVERFLRNCLMDTNKFVRAWAYHGFYEMSLQYPEYKDETKAFFDMAMRDEAASVKARIRNILKTGF